MSTAPATESVEVDAANKATEPAKEEAAAAAAAPAEKPATTEKPEAAAAPADAQTAGADDEEDQTNLIVNYLPQNVTEEKLKDMFSQFGELEHVKLMLDKQTQSSMGYGFVKYVKPESAAAAIAGMNGYQMDQKKLRVGYSHPRSEANVYVGNLKPTITKEELEQLFKQFGKIVECKILVDQETGLSKGCGFVKFEKNQYAENAIAGLSGMSHPEYSLRPLTVKFARKHDKTHHGHFGNGMQRHAAPRFHSGAAAPAAAPHRSSAPVEYSGYCLFIYNLPPDSNNDFLRSLFSRYGNITSANVMLDYNGQCRGFGFVNFEKLEDAQNAIKNMNGYVVKNRSLKVSFKDEKRR